MRENLERKTSELGLVQNELNQLKEFRKKKIQMQKELEEVGFKSDTDSILLRLFLIIEGWFDKKDQGSNDTEWEGA